MKKVIYYTKRNMGQFELQLLAKSIIENGKVSRIVNHFTTINAGSEEQHQVNNGSKCFVVSHLGIEYCVHMYGCEVTEIIETQEMIYELVPIPVE